MIIRSFAAALSLCVIPLVAQGAVDVEMTCPGKVDAGASLQTTVVLRNDSYQTAKVSRLFVTVVGTAGSSAPDVAVYGPFQRPSGSAGSPGIAPYSSVTVSPVILPAVPVELKGKVVGVVVAARPQGKKKYKVAECPVRIE